jgi:hypothetical protein
MKLDGQTCPNLYPYACLGGEECQKFGGCLFPPFKVARGSYAEFRHAYKGEFKPMTFEVKDSGERKQFESGMQRDVTTGKVRYDLAFDGPMFHRYAVHLTKGAEKYTPRNWMQADSEEEWRRFRESGIRHFVQWMNGDTDEDHAAAVIFNMNGMAYVEEKLGYRPTVERA